MVLVNMNDEERKLKRKEWDEKYRQTHQEEIRKRGTEWARNHKEQQKQYRLEHSEQEAKTKKIYQDAHKEEIKRYIANYRRTRYKNDAEWRELLKNLAKKSRIKRYYENMKEIKTLLGNKCANPYNLLHPDWCNDLECLQIDHIKSNGAKLRKNPLTKVNRKSAYNYYRDILREIKAGSKDYQLLCANCNWKKRYINKEVHR